MLKASPSVGGVISVASSITASLVGGDVVACALARAMAQQSGVSASDTEIAVTAMYDGGSYFAAASTFSCSAVSLMIKCLFTCYDLFIIATCSSTSQLRVRLHDENFAASMTSVGAGTYQDEEIVLRRLQRLPDLRSH